MITLAPTIILMRTASVLFRVISLSLMPLPPQWQAPSAFFALLNFECGPKAQCALIASQKQ